MNSHSNQVLAEEIPHHQNSKVTSKNFPPMTGMVLFMIFYEDERVSCKLDKTCLHEHFGQSLPQLLENVPHTMGIQLISLSMGKRNKTLLFLHVGPFY